jgi:predicted acyl esterase
MPRPVLFVLVLVGVAAQAAVAGLAKVVPPSMPVFDVSLEEVRIPMGDGVRLAADLWKPKGQGDRGRFPVLLEYLPYRKDEARGDRYDLYAYFARRGYVVARVDIRGRGNSEGTLIPYEYSEIEQKNGEDVIAWLAPSELPPSRGDTRDAPRLR